MKKEGVRLTTDELKVQAESRGYELVRKLPEIKIGDFCKLWDVLGGDYDYTFGFITKIESPRVAEYPYTGNTGTGWKYASRLTKEEKAKIQAAW